MPSPAAYLRVARADLVGALSRSGMAVSRPLRVAANGDGWLAARGLASESAATLTIRDTDTRPAPTRNWQLVVARSGLTLHRPAGDGPLLPREIQITGPGEERIRLDGSGDTVGPQTPLRYSRVAGAVRDERWRRLAGLSVLIVGTSRTGSALARLLVRSGVGQLTLVDPDTIEPHNLDAVGSPDDLGRFKVDVLAEELRGLQPRTSIQALPVPIDRVSAARVASNSDIIASCVDDPAAREVAARFAVCFVRTHLDVGTGVLLTDGPPRVGADIRIVAPATGCVGCLGGWGAPPPQAGPLPGGRLGSDPGVNSTAVGLAFRLLCDWMSVESHTRWIRVEGWDTQILPVVASRACPTCQLAGSGHRGLRASASASER